MIPRAAALLAPAALAQATVVLIGAALADLAAPQAAAAATCPAEDDRLLFHSCHGPAQAELLLLPEEADALRTPPAAGDSLVVGGTYTGTDQRDGGLPNPVGLFVDQGQVIGPHLARMDGILVIGEDGQPSIHHAARVPLRDGAADLADPDQRLDFAARSAEQGRSVMQSHLLITDGRVDVRQQMDAPKAKRRMLFTGPDGWGVYQTRRPVTLFDAAWELRQRYSPDMALNLDMGSFDYCVATRDGLATTCGVLGAAQTEKLSNLLRFTRPAS